MLLSVLPDGAPRTLLLSPSTALAQPRGWQALATAPPLPADRRYDEVHCVGGGSLLLWLMACAHRAPRGRVVHLHGPVVLPTPESCASWLARSEALGSNPAADDYEWRRQALSLGVAGSGLHGARSEWLKPLLTSIAMGRARELGARASDMQRRWERNGRLIHRPLPLREEDVVSELLVRHAASEYVEVMSGDEAPPTILRCGEIDCSVEELSP